MIVRGRIVNGGWTAEEDGTLLVRIAVEDIQQRPQHISYDDAERLRAFITAHAPTSNEAHDLLDIVKALETNELAPSRLRGRTATLVLGEAPAIAAQDTLISQSAAANADGDDSQMVDTETTSETVGGVTE